MTNRETRVSGLALIGMAVASGLSGQQSSRDLLVAEIDSIANVPVEAGRVAGMSVAVVQGNDTIVLKGYGYADLELDVPTPPRAVYEIGSLTKQFTAAAILLLQEQGKLSLEDELPRFLPDYPTQGHTITIRRLLDHTSGIKGYTEIAEFSRLRTQRLPRDSAVALFSSWPFDFAPGEAMIYNNSGYFLLGLVIEKASGQSYEDFVAEHLFEPTGMKDSRYCSERDIIKGRALGYDRGGDGLQQKRFLVHVWPYAAGSLCSTVGDLVAWTRALHGRGAGGSLLSEASYREMVTPGVLNDGTRLRYAKGLSVFERGGRRQIAHGGAINGFVSYLSYYPDHDLIVAVLINSTGVSSASVAGSIANVILGDPEPLTGVPFTGDASALRGTYRGPARGRPMIITIESSDATLTVRSGNQEPRPLTYLGGMTFGRGTTRFTFVRRGTAVDELRVDQVSGHYVLRKQEN